MIRAVYRSGPGDLDLSLVIPAYDEAESLPILLVEIGEALQGAPWSYEVLVVDDGSRDATPEVLLRLGQRDPRLRTLRLRHNHGQSAALVTGFRHARGRIVVTLDADLQNDPVDIPKLVSALESAAVDAVSGVRAERHDTWLRRLSSRIANEVRRRVLRDGITDVGCSLKAYRREALAHLPAFDGMHRFLPALVQLHGHRVLEIPVHHRPRLHGRAKYGVHDRLWRGIADLLAVRWMQSHWLHHHALGEELVRGSRPPGRSTAASPGAPVVSFDRRPPDDPRRTSPARPETTPCAES